MAGLRIRPSSRAAGSAAGPLERGLARAVAEGIISAEQAEEITALESGTAGQREGQGRRAVLAEVLGYAGGAVAVMSGVVIAQEIWADLAPWARVAVLAAVAVAAGTGGALLRDRSGAAGRLGSFLWLVTVIATSATAGVAGASLLAWSPASVALAAAGAATAVAAVLWWARPAALQQGAVFAGLVATVLVALARFDPSLLEYAGLVAWALGVAWVLLAWAEVPSPAAAAWLLGSIAMLIGPLTAVWSRDAMLVLGSLTAVVLLTIGVRFRRRLLAILGTAGLFVYVPVTLSELFGASLGPMAVIFVAGIVLMTAGVALARGLPHQAGARPG